MRPAGISPPSANQPPPTGPSLPPSPSPLSLHFIVPLDAARYFLALIAENVVVRLWPLIVNYSTRGVTLRSRQEWERDYCPFPCIVRIFAR